MFPVFLAAVVPDITISPLLLGMATLVDIMEKVWDVMVSNPLFVVFLGASLFALGIRIFRKVKSAAKR